MVGEGVDGCWVEEDMDVGLMLGAGVDGYWVVVGWRRRCILPSTASPVVGQGGEIETHWVLERSGMKEDRQGGRLRSRVSIKQSGFWARLRK